MRFNFTLTDGRNQKSTSFGGLRCSSAMSVLDASSLSIATRIFMKWNPDSSSPELVPAIITCIRMGPERNPGRLFLELHRENCSDDDRKVCLLLEEHENCGTSLRFEKTGVDVNWSLPQETPLSNPLFPLLGVVRATSRNNINFKEHFMRPLRFLSDLVQRAITKFPLISQKELGVHRNMIQHDVREKLPCTLLEWESVVYHVSNTLNIAIAHMPIYNAKDVPRYDNHEMSIHFATVQSLLSVFRHITANNTLNLLIKHKTFRKRRKMGNEQSAPRPGTRRGIDLIQVIGDFALRKDTFAFTIASSFNPSVSTRPGFQYPVLFRESYQWDNRDRKYVHDLSLKLMKRDELKTLIEQESETTNGNVAESYPRGAKETFLGLKWIRDKGQDERSKSFCSFDSDEIFGTLYICIPSTIFFGNLLVPAISRLCSESRSMFDLR